mmetsp:Transcript_99958/g.158209  ORF Transcript_99958/g.158209 Transcript_99958/m.158209 type:complete len:391 (-) Transcript_99958:10-1182(-)
MTLVVKNTFLEFEMSECRDRETSRRRASSFPASCCRDFFVEDTADSHDTEVGSTAGTDCSTPSWVSSAANQCDRWLHESSDFDVDGITSQTDEWATNVVNVCDGSVIRYGSFGEASWMHARHAFDVFPYSGEKGQEFDAAQDVAMRAAAYHAEMEEQQYLSGMLAALREKQHWPQTCTLTPSACCPSADWEIESRAPVSPARRQRSIQASFDSHQRTDAPQSPGKKQGGHKPATMHSTAPSPAMCNSANGYTTLMLRNLPNDYTRDMLVEFLESSGFEGRFDFVYLPFDFKKLAGLGYAFVNMTSCKDAARAMKTLTGFRDWKIKSQKVLRVTWSTPLQGLEANVERYRNSPVMHPDVPGHFKPLLLHNGTPVAFPPPTKILQAPASTSY